LILFLYLDIGRSMLGVPPDMSHNRAANGGSLSTLSAEFKTADLLHKLSELSTLLIKQDV